MCVARAAAVLCLVATVVGCGKKGPPLPPIVHIPASVDQISTRRVGSDVLVTMTVPAENIDKTTPADLAKIDLYAYTGTTLPPRARFLEASTLVATVPVLPPPVDETTKTNASNQRPRRARAPQPAGVPATPPPPS